MHIYTKDKMKKYIARTCEKALVRASKQFPALILTGPRQSGKTTLFKHLFGKTHTYVSLDNPNIRLMAIDDPELFLKNYPPPVIIDEIQYAPGLFSFIKIMIDENRDAHGQFLLTGSQSFPLMQNVTDSLAGRIAVFTLLSFSLRERFRAGETLGLSPIKKEILRGGFPDIFIHHTSDISLWFSSYLQTYLERDVREVRKVGDLTDFQRFLELLAAFNGQIINLSSMSRDLGVAVNTVKSWLSVLEASYQVILVKPFYMNKGKRIIKSPKIYFLDTGLLCHLNGVSEPAQVFKGVSSGQLFETVVLGEIVRQFYVSGKIPRIYYWRTSHGEEVDFIIEDTGKLIPIEVKTGTKASPEAVKELMRFSALFVPRVKEPILVNLSDSEVLLRGGVKVRPFQKFVWQNLV